MVSICHLKVSLLTMTSKPIYSYINIFHAHFTLSKCTSLFFSLMLPEKIMTQKTWLGAPYIYNWTIWTHFSEKHVFREWLQLCRDLLRHTKFCPFMFTKVYSIRILYPMVLLMTLGIYFASNLNNLIVIY